MSIPRLMVLMEAYELRRRRELGDLWRVMAHAQHAPEKPEDALPPVASRDVLDDLDDEGDPGGFDAFAMVHQARQDEEE